MQRAHQGPPSAPLTTSAPVCGALTLHGPSNWAATDRAVQAIPPVNAGLQRVLSLFAVGPGVVPQRRSPCIDRGAQNVHDRAGQPVIAGRAEALGWNARIDARIEQAFGSVDVADPDHHVS